MPLDRSMIDYKEFVSKQKSMLIAPAGYGKTYTIAECLKYTEGKQLILTHTHAGIISIKEKIKKANIKSSNYNVETITSFAQKYVLSFLKKSEIVEQQENPKKYYPFIIEEAIKFLRYKSISHIIRITYNGLFVDEYQDCTLKQHELILSLSEIIPTHIIGDHLQGIYGFRGNELVDIKDKIQMGKFIENIYHLHSPQRWINGNNEELGIQLKSIRSNIEKKEEINLLLSNEIKIIKVQDFYKSNDAKNLIYKLASDNQTNLLIIHPDSSNLNSRINFVKKFGNLYRLIESIDNKQFYDYSKKIDQMNSENMYKCLYDLITITLNKTEVKKWFGETELKSKRSERDKLTINTIRLILKKLEHEISFLEISKLLNEVKKLPNVKCYRKELISSICKALEEANLKKISVYEAMVSQRNNIRRLGRKIHGNCIGTTLLTKGLEFDTVLILDAHKFSCPKNLYVALTRASNKLIIFTESNLLNPKYD